MEKTKLEIKQNMGYREIIQGVDLVPQIVHSDARGNLVAFEEFGNVPFCPKRVFVIKAAHPGQDRGGHANSCDELISVISGAVTIEIDNGDCRRSVRLDSFDEALWVRAGILIVLKDFAPGTALVVCASERYEDTRHFDRPRTSVKRPVCPA
ncbi:FdtA/QdtA family cupin domain-containing protein [Methylobacterium sp. E-041]|uniref:sugar 3,4-ketoisomerase n=1 Tax=Methylobacterium sp. E-041 TaxID=2836573 RepID=UPI001FBBBAA2|nr:FdtA/QdtA family cupin domain-containing protein [Methylobacterium sp. E-041]MCJ2106763.1 FdtA/QdtA family cupin domain-containing protein [Methylobacterium sp. E-041]